MTQHSKGLFSAQDAAFCCRFRSPKTSPTISKVGFSQRMRLPVRICSFYDREEELVRLRDFTSGTGQFLLLTGPPDSGKTALLRHFAETTPALISTIDLRGGNFTTSAAFAAALKQSWRLSIIPKVSAPVMPTPSGPITVDLEATFSKIDEASGLTELLDALYSFMFQSRNLLTRLLGPTGAPTLIIDEANRLHNWAQDAEPDLRALLDFFVKVTKQDGVANVILASSEDFFLSWLSLKVGSQRFKTGVVGDFLAAEARDFLWHEYHVTVPDGLWSTMYATIGGRALFLTEVGKHFSRDKARGVDLQESWLDYFSDILESTIYHLSKGLNPELDTGAKESWTADQYLEILRTICDSEGGVVSYKTLILKFGSKVVDGLIRYNFLHLRPFRASAWAKDLRWYKGSFPIVMPRSMMDFYAMNTILRETEAK